MPAQNSVIKAILIGLLCCSLIGASAFPLSAQSPRTSAQDQGDVVRVFTDLVQTDVMVFDTQGRVINNLKREDFLLKIDGKDKPIDVFKSVTDSRDEEEQLTGYRECASEMVY